MSWQCRHWGRGAQAGKEQLGLPSSPEMAHQEGQPSSVVGHCSLKRNHCMQSQCVQKGGTSVSPLSQTPAGAALALPSSGLIPVVPVEEFEVLIVGDVNVIDLPGALVIGQVLPLDQVMDVSLFIKAVTQGTGS